MRNKVLILITAVVAMLGLLVPASAVGASSGDEVKAAASEVVGQVQAATEDVRSGLDAEGQALLDELVAQVSAVGDSVQSAHAWDWTAHPELKAALDAFIGWVMANMSALLPIIGNIILALLPAVPFLLGPIGDLFGIILAQLPTIAPIFVNLLCTSAPEFLPAFAALIGTLCGLINAVLPVVITLIPIILPILVSLAGPLVGIVCSVATSLLPAFAAIISGVCAVLTSIVTPPAP